MANQLAGIDIRNRYNILFLEIILYRLLRLFASIVNVIIFTNQPGYLDMPRFNFFLSNTIITDMRIGGHHDLAEIGGIGKNFLVAGHPGIKTDLACSCSYFPGSFAIKYGSISQQ